MISLVESVTITQISPCLENIVLGVLEKCWRLRWFWGCTPIESGVPTGKIWRDFSWSGRGNGVDGVLLRRAATRPPSTRSIASLRLRFPRESIQQQFPRGPAVTSTDAPVRIGKATRSRFPTGDIRGWRTFSVSCIEIDLKVWNRGKMSEMSCCT